MPSTNVDVKGVGIHQLHKFMFRVCSLLSAWVVVDFRNDGVMPNPCFAALAIIGQKDELSVVGDQGIEVQVCHTLGPG